MDVYEAVHSSSNGCEPALNPSVDPSNAIREWTGRTFKAGDEMFWVCALLLDTNKRAFQMAAEVGGTLNAAYSPGQL